MSRAWLWAELFRGRQAVSTLITATVSHERCTIVTTSILPGRIGEECWTTETRPALERLLTICFKPFSLVEQLGLISFSVLIYSSKEQPCDLGVSASLANVTLEKLKRAKPSVPSYRSDFRDPSNVDRNSLTCKYCPCRFTTEGQLAPHLEKQSVSPFFSLVARKLTSLRSR